ncbi:MAG: [protein-PII] uridylyltransferase [Marinicaulis sp.]|nr:[protein-PII] uridylyltransferase [Marinicaulis sp.]
MTKSSKDKFRDQKFDPNIFSALLSKAVEAEAAGQKHGAVGALLRDAARDIRSEAIAVSTRGDKIASRISDQTDAALTSLFSHNTTLKNDFAICAVGGYGRKKLSPHSDIDLLFLHAEGADDNTMEAVNFAIYPLWDSAVKIGHSVHTPKSGVAFAKDDMIARTAFLDARFLFGDEKLFKEFTENFDKLRRRTKNQFVDAKLREQDERQIKAGETRYVVEPDVKDGKGGLRDLQTLSWLYKYVFGGPIRETKAARKILDAAEIHSLDKAERFLWSVRVQLHDLRGRPDEILSFDIQPAVAERLGYADRPNMTAPERLMKHYFVNAVEVGRLTRVLCAKLEEERTKRLPHFPKLLPKALQSDEAPGKPNLRIRNGRLDFESAAKARRNPRDLFRLFRAYSKNPKIDFHPNALAVVAEQVPSIVTEVRKDPTIATLFNAILTKSADPVRVLRVMTETGLLGKYIPAYGSIVGRIDYGLYRRYTIDEHVLRAVGILNSLRDGSLDAEHPITTGIVRGRIDPLIFFLAVLLHESIWTVTDKNVSACDKLVQRITKRLGLNKDDAALVGWAAANHLLMMRTGERRNLTDSHAIGRFCEAIGDRERLDMAIVVSVCHLRVVGHHTWDDVKHRQLTEIYQAASVWFEKGPAALDERVAERAIAALEETKTRLAEWSREDRDAFLGSLTDTMLRAVEPEILVRFAHLAKAAADDKANAAVTITPRLGGLECVVYADDRAGLLADLAGAVAAKSLSVRSVQALTTDDGKVFDVFVVQSVDGSPIEDISQIRRLHEAMLSAARQSPQKPPRFSRRLGDRRAMFSVEPVVRIEEDAALDATVVETEGLDRPGLLHELTSALHRQDITIASAHISTYGERAVDVFYLRDKGGKKITTANKLAKIKATLLDVVSAGSGG